MNEKPQLTEWTCRLLKWHGLYQHPLAKDKSKWYVFPERAIAALENSQMDEFDFLPNAESYTEEEIRELFEPEAELPQEKRVTHVSCCYDCLFTCRETGDASLVCFLAENGPRLNNGENPGADFIAEYNAETDSFSWRARTVVDAEIVRRYWHHVPSPSELEYMADEGSNTHLNHEGKWAPPSSCSR
ncbi:MAG: hypothetical protein Q4E43_06315 [Akkermansia sp.]|nr:hypothetical protein [Akkermansia sp.]